MKRFLLPLLALAFFSAEAQDIPYTNGKNAWNPDSLGNHRAVIEFTGAGNVARVHIPWRRNDGHPENKRIIVANAANELVRNSKTGSCTQEMGDVWFEPISGKGRYYVYYMPYKNEGRSNYPKGVYLAPLSTASPQWMASLPATLADNSLVKEIQSVDEFNSVFPMEVIATQSETAQLLAANKGKAMLVFPEQREFPIRMNTALPYRWISNKNSASFKGKAARGEHYSFQLGVYALRALDSVSVIYADLKNEKGNLLAARYFSCLNNSGTRYDGSAFENKPSVPAGHVQALWTLVNIPAAAIPGTYTGKAMVHAKGEKPYPISISLQISNETAVAGNIDEPWKQTRLHWLNSTLAQENKVIAPYTPMEIQGTEISLLGRKVQLNNSGFPAQIQTFFTPEMTGYQPAPNNLLTEPIHFHFISKATGKDISFATQGIEFTRKEAGTVAWKAINTHPDIRMEVNASLEFDGFAHYSVKVTALNPIDFSDITMHIPFTKQSSRYMMGLGQKGGTRPDSIHWKWEVATKNQDGAWVGNVNAGLQYSLRDEKYSRPLNTNFYLQKPLILPSSWGNGNKGGIVLSEKGTSILANNFSGERSMKKGEVLYYNFTLLITPFHPLNTDFQWETRFYHQYKPIDTVKATGASVVNIHHANEINPWINYPFIEHKKMKAYIDEAHAKGLKVKIYNTVRELSNKAYETFPLRSLGHEVYSPGNGGGFSWLQEHVGKDYIAAWFVPGIKDAAIVNSGMSRWHNYYVEGMNWLVQQVGIDGIYLDDVAFDRITMKRIKRVLTANGHPGIIDLHSANQFNKSDGFNNSANLYMEHFPYLNRLWFGEYFDYEKNTPDFYLTEVSGIPFGLMGEMLQDGGNPWRGMLYGMTNRLPWSDNADPRPLWKIWDSFGMKDAKMMGYWSENCPVTTSHPNVPATVYLQKGKALVSIASWAAADTSVLLNIQWEKLGLEKNRVKISAPAIAHFQEGAEFLPGAEIPVQKNKGLILLLETK